MAATTRLTEPEAAAVLRQYGLGLERLAALPGKGTVNSNFDVTASGRRYFLRVNEGKRAEDVIAEAELVARLRERGIPTPEVVRTRGGDWLARAAGRPVSLFPWVAGREARPGDPGILSVVGRLLGRLHAVGRGLEPGELPENHYSLEELERRLSSFAGDTRFAAVVPRLGEELARARKRSSPASGLIHQDLFPDNLLIGDSGELLAVLDFEQATHGGLVYDLAVCLNAWCWDGERIAAEPARQLVEAYGAERALTSEELAQLVDEGALAAARFAITRITDVWLPAGVDPDLRRRKDYADYVRRLEYWRSAR